jgi:hypothetical protein
MTALGSMLKAALRNKEALRMAKKAKRAARKRWTKEHVRELKSYSREKTTVAKISRSMKRSVGALRQKAFQLGISLGHQT